MKKFSISGLTPDSLERCYPSLYECDCLFLSRSQVPFREQAEQYVSNDLIVLARRLEQDRNEQSFVLLLYRVGGCLAEARLLLLIRCCFFGAMRVVVIEPMQGENNAIDNALSDFDRLVFELTGSPAFFYKTIDHYASVLQEGLQLRADAVVLFDSDEDADVFFTFDNLVNRRKGEVFSRHCCSPVCYFARLAVDQFAGVVVRHLHCSLLCLQQKNVLYQLFYSGEKHFLVGIPLVWVQGEQVFPALQKNPEEAVGVVVGPLEQNFSRFFEERSFLFVQDWQYFAL